METKGYRTLNSVFKILTRNTYTDWNEIFHCFIRLNNPKLVEYRKWKRSFQIPISPPLRELHQ